MRWLNTLGFALVAAAYATWFPLFLGSPWWVWSPLIVAFAGAVMMAWRPAPGGLLLQSIAWSVYMVVFIVRGDGWLEWGIAGIVGVCLLGAAFLHARNLPRVTALLLIIAAVKQAVWIVTNAISADHMERWFIPGNAIFTIGLVLAAWSMLAGPAQAARAKAGGRGGGKRRVRDTELRLG